MKLVELKEIIKNDKFVLHNGHRFTQRKIRQIKAALMSRIEFFMKDPAKDRFKQLNQEIERNTPYSLALVTHVECPICGAILQLMLLDDDTFQLVEIVPTANDYKNYRLETECIFHGKRPPVKYTLNVDSPMYFVNHFGSLSEVPEIEDEYTRGYDINSHLGRYNISKVLAHKNIGYGQTGNASGSVYFNKNNNIVYIINFHPQDIILDYEYAVSKGNVNTNEIDRYNNAKQLLFKLGDYCGRFTMDCWRWMCADESTCRIYNLKVNNNVYVDELTDQNMQDVVKVDLPHGRWKVTHYGCTDEYDGMIWAKLERLKD